jgi:hypothetical protein
LDNFGGAMPTFKIASPCPYDTITDARKSFEDYCMFKLLPIFLLFFSEILAAQVEFPKFGYYKSDDGKCEILVGRGSGSTALSFDLSVRRKLPSIYRNCPFDNVPSYADVIGGVWTKQFTAPCNHTISRCSLPRNPDNLKSIVVSSSERLDLIDFDGATVKTWQFDRALDAPGLSVTPLAGNYKTSEFDCEMQVADISLQGFKVRLIGSCLALRRAGIPNTRDFQAEKCNWFDDRTNSCSVHFGTFGRERRVLVRVISPLQLEILEIDGTLIFEWHFSAS